MNLFQLYYITISPHLLGDVQHYLFALKALELIVKRQLSRDGVIANSVMPQSQLHCHQVQLHCPDCSIGKCYFGRSVFVKSLRENPNFPIIVAGVICRINLDLICIQVDIVSSY